MSTSAPRVHGGGRLNAASEPLNLNESSLTARLVGLSASRAWIVVTLAIILCAATAQYVMSHFTMTTDTSALLSSKLSWRLRRAAFGTTFPQDASDVVVVVDGRTPELSEEGAARLAAALSGQSSLVHSVRRPDSGPFWAHEGLLFQSTADVKKVIAQLLAVQPFLGSMASDPSLRGLANTLSLMMRGAGSGNAATQELGAPLRSLADALQDVNRGKPHFFPGKA